VSWATDCHFLLARINGDRMTVRAIGALDDPGGDPQDIARFDRDGREISGPIEIRGQARADQGARGGLV
jgi:hypothetical protein